MKYFLNQILQILERTPHALRSLLYCLDEDWIQLNEGTGTWSPYDVVTHLIHCDKDNWIPRIKIIISDSEIKVLEAFDRWAMFEKNKEKTLNQLLDDFLKIRFESVAVLRSLNISEKHFVKTALHPELGSVTLSQLIATWAVHDLDHICQISRVMAKRYKNEVGPWIQYMRVLNP